MHPLEGNWIKAELSDNHFEPYRPLGNCSEPVYFEHSTNCDTVSDGGDVRGGSFDFSWLRFCHVRFFGGEKAFRG